MVDRLPCAEELLILPRRLSRHLVLIPQLLRHTGDPRRVLTRGGCLIGLAPLWRLRLPLLVRSQDGVDSLIKWLCRLGVGLRGVDRLASRGRHNVIVVGVALANFPGGRPLLWRRAFPGHALLVASLLVDPLA